MPLLESYKKNIKYEQEQKEVLNRHTVVVRKPIYLNLIVSLPGILSGLLPRRFSSQVGTLAQSTVENSITERFIALTKTASSGFSNGIL